MDDIIKIINLAISIFSELSNKLNKEKEENWNNVLSEINDKAKIISNIPYLSSEDFNFINYDENEFSPINNIDISNINIEKEINESFLIEESDLKNCLCDEDLIEENFDNISNDELCLCDENPIIDNSFELSKYVEPNNENIIKEDFPHTDCTKKIEKWTLLLQEYIGELNNLKKWESDNYISIQYYLLFSIYFKERINILKELNNLSIKELKNILVNISIKDFNIKNTLKILSNHLDFSKNNEKLIIFWKKKKKEKGTFFEWGDEFSNQLKLISDNDPKRTEKILFLEKSIKKIYLNDNIENLSSLIIKWTKRKIIEQKIKGTSFSIEYWKKENEIYLSLNNGNEITLKLNRIKELEELIKKLEIDMMKDLENSKCGNNDESFYLENPEDSEYRGNPNINSPNSLTLKYWKKYANIASLVNIIPTYWPIGILIPNPSGLIKIPMPIIWKPIFVFSIPSGIGVLFLNICGTCPSPVLFIWNSDPNKTIGSINSKNMSFPIAIRPSNNWKKSDGSKILDVIPWISNLFSKYDPFPEKTKSLPYYEDDLPSWERLSIKNPMFLLHLTDWCKNGKKSCGWFENQ